MVLEKIKKSSSASAPILIKKLINSDFITKSGLFIIILGLFTMDFFHTLSNIGIILITVSSIWYYINNKVGLRQIFTSSNFTPFIIIFILYVFSFLFTTKENLPNLFSDFERKISFFILSFCFIILPPFNKKLYNDLLFFFFILVIFTAIPCTIIYFNNKAEILNSYRRSGVMPTPVNHVRYSLMVCYAICAGTYLIFNKYFSANKRYNILLLSGTVFLIFFLHLLAVRSGLICLYILLFIVLIYFLIKKRYTALVTLSASMVMLIIISFQYIETIQAKWAYTLYDIEQSSNEESPNNLSISGRLLSNKIAFSVFKDHPLLGAGEANLKTGMRKIYKEEYPQITENNYLMPHNEYLSVLAATGILGFFIFFSSFLFPLLHNKNFRFFPLLSIYVILTISFIVEDTLHTQLGIIFGLFFIMINLHSLQSNKIEN
jgi:O-antigen ligase